MVLNGNFVKRLTEKTNVPYGITYVDSSFSSHSKNSIFVGNYGNSKIKQINNKSGLVQKKFKLTVDNLQSIVSFANKLYFVSETNGLGQLGVIENICTCKC